MRFDWNDLRFFAAVLEHGSTARAGRAMGVDQTTATRRATRRIRITGDDYLVRTVLVPALTRFAAKYPDVQVEVDVSAVVRDLQAGEADMAVRAAGEAPGEPSLIRRKLRDDPWAVYCSAAYAETRGAPRDLADVAGHPIVALHVSREDIRSLGLEDAVRQVVDSVSAAEAVIRTGACVGALPRLMADALADLRFCFDVPAASAYWLLYPERLRRVPEVKALAGLIVEAFRRESAGADA